MTESSVSLRAIRSVRISIVVGTALLGAGLLSHFYMATDPNPEWWAVNYPWMRFATLSLLFSGVLASTVGTSLAFLETLIFLNQGLTTRIDNVETAVKKSGSMLRTGRIREARHATRYALEATPTGKTIIIPNN